MLKATLKGLLAHRLRLTLTVVSVVAGVAFVAGTYVLTDTIDATFDNLFSEVQAGVDVTVRAESGFGSQARAGDSRDTVPQSLLALVRSVPGVAVAEGGVGGTAQLVAPDGEPVTTTGAPNLGFSWTETPELSPLRLLEGRPPEGPGEVLIDATTANDTGIAIGDEVGVITVSAPERARVVGIARFGEADNLAGARLAVFELATAQRLFDKVGVYDQIDVAADDGVGAGELRARLARALPDGVEAVLGDDVAAESAQLVKNELGFLSTVLLVFAGVSVFVGAFIIFNTFTILVAQRSRELALLRALGASRRQVRSAVVIEALLVGLVASVLGLGLGIAVAAGLRALLDAFGISLPTTGLVVQARTVASAFAVGTLVTLVAALGPARRASRVAPMAALRSPDGDGDGVITRVSLVGGVVVGVLGLAALAFGLAGEGGIGPVGLGVALTFLGVAMLSPLVARPVARTIGSPLARLRGLPGRLGRQNALRNPRRTASTAAALMIGLGLVATMSVMAASVKRSATAIFERSLTADFIVTTEAFFPTVAPVVADTLAALDELSAVTGLQIGSLLYDGSRYDLSAADPRALGQVLAVDTTSGSLDDLAPGTVLVEESFARARGLDAGDVMEVAFARTGPTDLEVVGRFAENDLIADLLISTATYEANFTDRLDLLVLARTAPGTDPASAREAIGAALSDSPNLRVQDQGEVRADQEAQIDQLLGLVTALLGLAVVIALLGIVNTLALSVLERTRELGLLRAVGMSRRQVRSMVRVEAVIIAVFGAVLGLVVGTFFGWSLVSALGDDGITELVIPGGQLATYVVAAAGAGILAAVGPARRAARLDVLQAIAFE